MEKLLTVKQVAELMQLHEVTIRRYIRDGKLAAVRIGRRVRVPREAVEQLLSPEMGGDSEAEAVVGFREPALTYEAGASPTLLARMTADLAALDQPNLLKVSEFVTGLKAEQEKQARKALARQIVAEATRLAKQDTRSWEEVWDDFEAVTEKIRQEAIEKGTAIEGDYYGD